MADEDDQRVEDALETLVSITEKSGNLRKDLRTDILETVSVLRKVFSQLKSKLKNANEESKKLQNEVNNAKESMARGGDSRSERQVAPSLDHAQQSPSGGARQVLPPAGGRRKLYAEAVKNEGTRQYRITLKAKDGTLSTEQIKFQLREHINPTNIKVGIQAVRTLGDKGIQIETDSEEEINTLSTEISAKLGERLEIKKHTLRKPIIIIYNVTEEITTENITAIIQAHNPEINDNGEDIIAKFRYTNKKGRYNIVMEVGPKTRLQILQTKLKIGWEICNAADYLTPTRCFTCCRYNHKSKECRGEETCPHCAGKHKMKECTASASEQKCINCINYNRYNKNDKINENHSALSRDCPSLKARTHKVQEQY